MRRLLTALILLTFAACGDGPTGTEGPPTGPPSLAILSGDRQETSVEDTIPFQAEVQLTRGGDPVPGQLADWRVTMDGCGKPFVTTTESDSSGVVKNRAIAGTRAHTRIPDPGFCTMEVRWIDQSTGEAITDTTILYRVIPGVPNELTRPAFKSGGPCDAPTLHIGDSLDLSVCFTVYDQYGNPLPEASVLPIQWDLPSRNSLVMPGYEGKGWSVDSVPQLHKFGWYPRSVKVDTTVASPEYPADTVPVGGGVVVWSDSLGTIEDSDASSAMSLTAMLPACWEETNHHEGEVTFSGIPWEEGCVQPWEDW